MSMLNYTEIVENAALCTAPIAPSRVSLVLNPAGGNFTTQLTLLHISKHIEVGIKEPCLGFFS